MLRYAQSDRGGHSAGAQDSSVTLGYRLMQLFVLDHMTPSDMRETFISILEIIPELGQLFSIFYAQES